MAAALAFDGFDRPALAEAEGGIDDTETMEAKPAQKTSEVFLHLAIATGRFTVKSGSGIGVRVDFRGKSHSYPIFRGFHFVAAETV